MKIIKNKKEKECDEGGIFVFCRIKDNILSGWLNGRALDF